MKNTSQAFQDKLITLDIDTIAPSKELSRQILTGKKYRAILASVETIGLVEPPVITFKNGQPYLLDGHIRLHILKSLGKTKIDCLVSTDDESYTYNRHISHISNVQERNMILRAIESGASEEKIAAALGIDIKTLQYKKNLLENIHPDVVEMFKTRKIPTKTFDYLRKMKDIRQIEIATFMCNSNNFSAPMAHHFYVATPHDMLRVPPRKNKEEEIRRQVSLENTIKQIQKEYKLIYTDFGKHVAKLQVAQAWVRSIFANKVARKFLEKHYSDIARRFNELVDLTDLNSIKLDESMATPE